jgi:hypothetical protein
MGTAMVPFTAAMALEVALVAAHGITPRFRCVSGQE